MEWVAQMMKSQTLKLSLYQVTGTPVSVHSDNRMDSSCNGDNVALDSAWDSEVIPVPGKNGLK